MLTFWIFEVISHCKNRRWTRCSECKFESFWAFSYFARTRPRFRWGIIIVESVVKKQPFDKKVVIVFDECLENQCIFFSVFPDFSKSKWWSDVGCSWVVNHVVSRPITRSSYTQNCNMNKVLKSTKIYFSWRQGHQPKHTLAYGVADVGDDVIGNLCPWYTSGNGHLAGAEHQLISGFYCGFLKRQILVNGRSCSFEAAYVWALTMPSPRISFLVLRSDWILRWRMSSVWPSSI